LLPRGTKADAVVRALENAGGIRRPGRGSHVNVKMPNGQIVTIPRHGEVKMGLLHAAVRKAGLTDDEFVGLLGGSTWITQCWFTLPKKVVIGLRSHLFRAASRRARPLRKPWPTPKKLSSLTSKLFVRTDRKSRRTKGC